jgi:predicted nuclease of predicted toxin-antitoxin system
MKLWLDAQLPPLLAGWIVAQEWGIQAFAVRAVGLRDASDAAIFRAAREAGELQQHCPAGASCHHPAEGNGSSA